jgi:hypothetical protein
MYGFKVLRFKDDDQAAIFLNSIGHFSKKDGKCPLPAGVVPTCPLKSRTPGTEEGMAVCGVGLRAGRNFRFQISDSKFSLKNNF